MADPRFYENRGPFTLGHLAEVAEADQIQHREQDADRARVQCEQAARELEQAEERERAATDPHEVARLMAERRVLACGTMDDMLEVDHPWVRDYFHGPRGRAAARAA